MSNDKSRQHDTPRTNAVDSAEYPHQSHYMLALRDHALQLERELAEMTRRFFSSDPADLPVAPSSTSAARPFCDCVSATEKHCVGEGVLYQCRRSTLSATASAKEREQYIEDLEATVRYCADLLRSVHYNVVADYGTSGDGIVAAEKTLRDVKYFVEHGMPTSPSQSDIDCSRHEKADG